MSWADLEAACQAGSRHEHAGSTHVALDDAGVERQRSLALCYRGMLYMFQEHSLQSHSVPSRLRMHLQHAAPKCFKETTSLG